jgi:cytochrome oxidase Cu insertion factor (SCO1/SenC/PrrC family)
MARGPISALALALAACASPPPDPAQLMNELMSGTSAVGTSFTLEDQYRARRSLTEFRGKLVLLYFGYTYCPDVCPTDLARIARAVSSLGPLASQVQPIFVTLDPDRDTPELLRDYAAAFDARLIALRGGNEETRRVATAFKVYYEKRPLEDGSYLVDHAAFTFLLDREGRYVAFFPPGTSAERMAAMLRDVL